MNPRYVTVEMKIVHGDILMNWTDRGRNYTGTLGKKNSDYTHYKLTTGSVIRLVVDKCIKESQKEDKMNITFQATIHRDNLELLKETVLSGDDICIIQICDENRLDESISSRTRLKRRRT